MITARYRAARAVVSVSFASSRYLISGGTAGFAGGHEVHMIWGRLDL